MKIKKNFLKKLAAVTLGFVMTLGVGAAGYAASANETKAGQTTVTINQSALGTSGTNTSTWMTDFSKDIGGATFFVHTMGTKGGTHAMQWNNKGYIYQTAAPSNVSYISSVSAVTNSKKITIYGSKTAFSDNSGGTSIGDITGTGSKTCTSTDGYKFIRVVGTASSTQVTSITITYETASKSLSSIAVSNNHRSFTVGDTFVKETVTATYSDSTTADVTNSATFSSPDMNTAGSKEINVSYTEGGTTKSTSYDISVTAPRTISSIEITSGFTKKTYIDNQDWDPTGLVVTAHYSSGSPATETLNSDKYTLSYNPAKPNSKSIKSVTVTATLKSDTSKTDDLLIEGITITAAPKQLNWTASGWVSDNNCTVSAGSNVTTYTTLEVIEDQLTFSVNSSGNNGSFWDASGVKQWRIYQNQSAILTISFTPASGYKINSVTVTYAIDKTGVLLDPSGNNLTSGTKYTLTEPSNTVTLSVGNTSSGVSNGQVRITGISLEYTEGEIQYPNSVTASFISGKGTYYNGTKADNSRLNFSDIKAVFNYDQGDPKDAVISSVSIYKNSTLVQTLTNSSTTYYSFSGTEDVSSTSVTWTITVTCNGVKEDGGNLDSDPVSFTLLPVGPLSYEWTTEPATTTFYSHLDTFSYGGAIKLTRNDGSTTSSGTRVDEIHVGSKDGEVIDAIPTHSDGTIDVSSATTYWIETYFRGNDLGTGNLFNQVTISMPTISVAEGNPSGTSYYTNVQFNPNPSVTINKGSTPITATADDYDITLLVGGNVVAQPYTPTAEETITVKVSLKKDSNIYGSYTANVEVSERELTELTILDQEFTAGDLFRLGSEEILLSFIEGSPDTDYLNTEDVVFTIDDVEINTSDYVFIDMDGATVHAVYSEGDDNTVETDFEISVAEKPISPYTPGSEPNYFEKVTANSGLTDGKYLVVCEEQNLAFNGALATLDAVSNTVAVSISNNQISLANDTENKIKNAAFTFTASNGAFLGTGGYYFGNASNSNALTSSDTALTNTVSISDGNADIVSSGGAYLRYNATSGQDRFRYYKSSSYTNQKAIQLYKQPAASSGEGNKIDYLISIIDSIRLNQEKYTQTDLKAELKAHTEWATASTYLTDLTAEEIASLSVADKYGPNGSTYKAVYDLALACSVIFNGTNISSNGASSVATGAAYSAKFTASSGYSLPSTITVTMGGNAFSDYNYDSSKGTFSIDGGKINNDIVITASAIIIDYTITYNLNGGSVETSNPKSYNIETEATSLNPASKTGYQFLGWYTEDGTDDEWGDQVTQIGGGTTGDLNLYARFSINSYNVTLNGTNISFAQGDPTSCNYGGTYSATLVADDDYILPGSITVKLEDGTAYSGYTYSSVTGAFSISSMPASDITITAVAEKGAYQISYKEVDGTAIDPTGLVTEYYKETGATLTPAANRPGYNFDGWYSDQTLQTKVTQIEIGSTGNKIFYAKWVFAATDALNSVTTDIGMSYKYDKDESSVVSKSASSSSVSTNTFLSKWTQTQSLGSVSSTDFNDVLQTQGQSIITGFQNPSNSYIGGNGGSGVTTWKELDCLKVGKSGNSSGTGVGSVTLNLDSSIEFTSIKVYAFGASNTGTLTINNVTKTVTKQASGSDVAPMVLDYEIQSGTNTLTLSAGQTTGNYSICITKIEFIGNSGPVYSNGDFRFNIKNTGMNSLVSTYGEVYDDIGIMLSYEDNGKVRNRYFSFVTNMVYEDGKDPAKFTVNSNGWFVIKLGNLFEHMDRASVEFTAKAYIKDNNQYHYSSQSVTYSVVSYINYYHSQDKYAKETQELYEIFCTSSSN